MKRNVIFNGDIGVDVSGTPSELRVVHASSLECIQIDPHLRHVSIEASELPNLEPLTGVTELSTLKIRYSTIADLSALRELSHLDTLEMSFCDVDDLSLIEGLPSLRFANLVGTPWDDDAENTRIQQLAARLDWLIYSPLADWQLAREGWFSSEQ